MNFLVRKPRFLAPEAGPVQADPGRSGPDPGPDPDPGVRAGFRVSGLGSGTLTWIGDLDWDRGLGLGSGTWAGIGDLDWDRGLGLGSGTWIGLSYTWTGSHILGLGVICK